MIETYRRVFKFLNVNFILIKTIYVQLLACYLNKYIFSFMFITFYPKDHIQVVFTNYELLFQVPSDY